MAQQRTALIVGGFLVVLLILGTADALLTRNLTVWPEEQATAMQDSGQPTAATTSAADTGGGVAKQNGPDILTVLKAHGITAMENKEKGIIDRVIAGRAPVFSWAMMKDRDRLGFLSVAESPEIKVIFLALKEALQSSFSPNIKDLLDEAQNRSGKPPRNFLSFLDPAISEERIVFVRVRERLYEVHIAPGKDKEVFDVVDALSE